jgi:hypothetical protein
MFNLACRRQVKKIEIMNLDNLNLVELNAQEVEETEGGLFGIDDGAIALSIAVGVLLIENWPDIKKGLHDGWYGK